MGSSRTVFKKLEDAYKSVLVDIKQADKRDKERLELLQKQKELLDEIVEYVNTYDWLTHEDSKDRVKFYLKHKGSYQEFCKQFGVSYEAAKVSVSYANKKCLDKIGVNTIDLILEGRLDEARTTFYFRMGRLKLEDFIVDSVIPYIPKPQYMTVKLEDCKDELTFLKLYSQTLLDKRVELLDRDKMAYLRYVLEGDNPKFAEERLYLLELLEGNIKVKDYIQDAKERNIY